MHKLTDERIATAVKLLLGLTVLLGAAPLLLYAWARLIGSLPSSDAWQLRAGNHGPWWDSWQGLVIYLSDMLLMMLGVLTLIGGAVLALCRRRGRVVIGGLALAALQAATVVVHFCWLFWTVD